MASLLVTSSGRVAKQAIGYETAPTLTPQLNLHLWCNTILVGHTSFCVATERVNRETEVVSLSEIMQLGELLAERSERLSAAAQNALYEAWESELSDVPLIPGMK